MRNPTSALEQLLKQKPKAFEAACRRLLRGDGRGLRRELDLAETVDMDAEQKETDAILRA